MPFSPPVLFPSLQETVGKNSLKTNHADCILNYIHHARVHTCTFNRSIVAYFSCCINQLLGKLNGDQSRFAVSYFIITEIDAVVRGFAYLYMESGSGSGASAGMLAA